MGVPSRWSKKQASADDQKYVIHSVQLIKNEILGTSIDPNWKLQKRHMINTNTLGATNEQSALHWLNKHLIPFVIHLPKEKMVLI